MISLISHFQKRVLVAFTVMTLATGAALAADKINVLVWDEQQPVPKKLYPNFPGNYIADHLKNNPRLNVTSANINQPEQGLSTRSLNEADVLIFWGHVRHRDISEAKSQEIVDLVKAGKLDFVVLHSAHWAVPFMVAMQEVAAQDALAQLPDGIRENVDVNFKGKIRWQRHPTMHGRTSCMNSPATKMAGFNSRSSGRTACSPAAARRRSQARFESSTKSIRSPRVCPPPSRSRKRRCTTNRFTCPRRTR